jgi:hypothetical protein
MGNFGAPNSYWPWWLAIMCFTRTAVSGSREPHPHGVAAGGVERRVGGDVDVAGAVTGGGIERTHEPISAGRPAKHADDVSGRRLRRPLAGDGPARLLVASLHDWPRPRKNFRPWLC